MVKNWHYFVTDWNGKRVRFMRALSDAEFEPFTITGLPAGMQVIHMDESEHPANSAKAREFNKLPILLNKNRMAIDPVVFIFWLDFDFWLGYAEEKDKKHAKH